MQEHTRGTLALRYRHDADAWPWTYRAEQRFSLQQGALDIALSLTNLSDTPMPAGLGLHPYFPATRHSRIEAKVERMWETDDQVLPTELIQPAKESDPNRGLESGGVELDNVFTGWSRAARILWPEWRRALDIRAESPLDFLVFYTPAGEPYFCVEPVSNATDAFNLAKSGRSDTGMIELASGETVTARVSFVPMVQ